MTNVFQGLTRRAVLAGATTVLAGGVAQAQPAPGPAVRFRGVRVDVERLIAIGGRGPSRVITQVLPGKLAESFADLLSPRDARAPVLVARIDRIFLSSYADAPSIGIAAFGNTDSMEGAGLVVAGRQTIATTPLRVSLPASYSGLYYLPDIDERRIASLCESFASWLRREMNL